MANYIKTNDPGGKMLKLARKRIQEKERSDKAKALIKAEDDFYKFAATLSDLGIEPTQSDCTRAAAFLREQMQNQILLLSKLDPTQKEAKKRIFQNLPRVLPTNLRKLCRVDIIHKGDQVIYRFGIWRGESGLEQLYPILMECE